MGSIQGKAEINQRADDETKIEKLRLVSE